jgi:hypothetical protein
VVAEQDRAFIIHVASREVEKQPDAAARVDAQVTSLASQNEMIAFMGWIADRIEAANVQQLNRR